MRVIEKTLIILVAISTVLKLCHVTGALMLAVVAYSSLSFMYCFAGVLIFNNIRLRKSQKQLEPSEKPALGLILLSVFAGLGLSVLLYGALFKLGHWPDARFQFNVACCMEVPVMLICIVGHFRSRRKVYSNILIRVIPLLLFCLAMLLFYK